MLRDRSFYQVDFPCSPVDVWVILCQPRVSQDDVISFPEVEHKEVLRHVLPVNSEMEFDLVADYSLRIVGAIGILHIHGSSEFLQQPLHPPS